MRREYPEDLYAIWLPDGQTGLVLMTTEENGRTEYHIAWDDEPECRHFPYGPEDIESGELVVGSKQAIEALYGKSI